MCFARVMDLRTLEAKGNLSGLVACLKCRSSGCAQVTLISDLVHPPKFME